MSEPHAILFESKNPARFLVRFKFFSKQGLDLLRDRYPRDGHTRYWDDEENGWSLEITNLKHVYETFDASMTVELDDGLAKLLRQQRGHNKPPPQVEITDYKFKTEPFDHQRRGFHLGRMAPCFAFLMEMGCGKTKTVIDIYSHFLANGSIDGAVIVTRKSVLFTWEKELSLHSPLPPEKRRAVVIAGQNRAAKLEEFAVAGDNAHFIIVSYETMRDYEEQLTKIMKRRRMAMALDESTRIKSPPTKSQKTKAAFHLRKLAVRRDILTGTPIANSPLDAWAQFYFLDPNILGHASYTSFKGEYAKVLVKPGHQLSGILIIGYKNLGRLEERIRPHSFRVLKKDCLDLPEKIYKTVELRMGETQASYYQQMKEESIIEFDGKMQSCSCGAGLGGAHAIDCKSYLPVVLAAPHVLTRTTRLTQLTGGFYPVQDALGNTDHYDFFEENPKLEAAMDILEEAIEANHKCIIWCRFTPEIELFTKELSKRKIGTVVLTGMTETKERAIRIQAFQELPEVMVFLGQIQAGGSGITLTAATKVLYYSNSLSLEDRLQSEDRAHRIGQRSDVEYVDFCYRHTVDMTIRKALKDKKNFADIVTGDNMRRAFEGEL